MAKSDARLNEPLFTATIRPVEIHSRIYEQSFVVVDPAQLHEAQGFESNRLPVSVVARIIEHTVNGMIEHGASALGLDLDSMFGSIHAVGRLEAARDVGSVILTEVAPRTDSVTWEEWITEEFPNAVAAIYGPDSNPSQLAVEVMQK